MPYRFVREAEDYTDLASGAVLHSLPGRPGFPVRLASELFQRALSLRGPGSGRCVLYDPCCGTGYLLAVIGLLHGDSLAAAIGSDADPEVVEVARKNLALLGPAGLRARIEELRNRAERFGRPSHRAAVESARRLLPRVERHGPGGALATDAFAADALDPAALAAGLAGTSPDLVIIDPPYGVASRWAGHAATDGAEAVDRMLGALHPILAPGAVVVTVLPKGLRPAGPGYARVQRFQLGRRAAHFWRASRSEGGPTGAASSSSGP